MTSAADDSKRKATGSKSSWLWIYALLLTGVVAYFVLPQTVGTQIRTHVLTRLQKHWPEHIVKLGTVRFEPNVGVMLDDLRIWPKDAPWNATPIVKVDRILVLTHLELEQWASEPFVSDRLILEGLQCEVRPAADGSFPITKLYPPPAFGRGAPRVMLRNARIKVFQDASSPTVSLELRELQAEMVKSSEGFVFKVSTQTDTSNLVEIKGSRDTKGNLQLAGQVTELRIDSALLRRLPLVCTELTKPLDGLACTSNLVFRADQLVGQPWRYVTKVEVKEGRYSCPQLPFPAESVFGEVIARPGNFQITRMAGRIGGATFALDGSLTGTKPDSSADLNLRMRDVDVSPQTLAALPEKLRNGLEQYNPRGLLDVDMHLIHETKWISEGTAVLRGMEVEAAKFPYPVRNVTGVVQWAKQQVTGHEITGILAGQRLHCEGSFSMEPNGPMDLKFTIDGPTPIDETLLHALTPRGQSMTSREQIVRRIQPQGMMQLIGANIKRDSEGRLSHLIQLKVFSGRMRYADFPYPLNDVQGLLEIDEHGFRMREFRGQNNDSATIQMSGSWTNPIGMSPGHLDLKIDGYGVPLDDSLRIALPARVRQTWNSLGPSGTLDHVHVQLSKDEGQEARFAITAQQWGGDAPATRVVTLVPVAVPYRLDVRRATVRMNGDAVFIEQLDAWHRASHITTTGHCTRNAQGKWILHLDLLPGSRMQADEDLLSALPEGTRNSLTEINLQGPVGLRGTSDIVLPDEEASTPEMYWDVLLQLEGNYLGRSAEVQGVRGEVHFRGSRKGDLFYARGGLEIDSLHIKGVQATRLAGPFEIHEGRVLWGRAIGGWGQADNEGKPEAVSASIFGGQLSLDGQLSLSDSRYRFNAMIADADLPTMLSELGQSQASVRGRCGVTLNDIQGIIGQNRALSGSGSAYLRDANLYQLPPIVMLLGVLRVDPQEDSAFTTGDTKFHIDGDQVVFDSIQLWGDVIALYGGGTVNARRELELVLDTHVSPQNIWSQVMRPISGQRYNLWSIQVGGTVDAPQIKRLPQMEKAFDRLLPEATKSNSGDEPPPLIGTLPIMRQLKW